MIRFSDRLGALPGYPLAEIPSIKRRLIEAGMDVIDLGAGDNDTPPPDTVLAAMHEALKQPALSKYGFQQGLMAYRQAVSRWVERRFGMHFDPATETLPLLGSKEGLSHLPLMVGTRVMSCWCPSRATRPTSAGPSSRGRCRISVRCGPTATSCSSSMTCRPTCSSARSWSSRTIPTTRPPRSRAPSTSRGW